MIHTAAIVGVVAVVAIVVFFWRRFGAGSGRAFGNRVAAQVGIPTDLFHALLDHGVKGTSRELLTSLARSGMTPEQAGVELAPVLARGVERLEAHFGAQQRVDAVKPAVARLVAAFERRA